MASMIFIAPTAEAKTSTNSVSSTSSAAQPRYWRGRRTVTTTRTVRVGRRIYRDTYRTTYNRFGRVVSSRLIRRVIIR